MDSAAENKLKRTQTWRRQDGAALVEFALVLPVLLMFLLGVLEFGRAFNYWIDETHLANIAARYAAVNNNPGPEATLQESVLSEGSTSEFREGGSTSVPSGAELCIEFPEGNEVGDPVEATITVDYNWIPLLGIGATSGELESSATMRIEQLVDDPGIPAGCSGGA